MNLGKPVRRIDNAVVGPYRLAGGFGFLIFGLVGLIAGLTILAVLVNP